MLTPYPPEKRLNTAPRKKTTQVTKGPKPSAIVLALAKVSHHCCHSKEPIAGLQGRCWKRAKKVNHMGMEVVPTLRGMRENVMTS